MLITRDGHSYDFDKWPKWRRLDTSIESLRVAQQKALRTSVVSFSTGEIAAE